MSNSYAGSLPRSINFKETNMREFVMANSFIKNNKENRQINHHSYTNNFYPNQLPFDLYNKNNLLLHSCSPQDIQIVQKNPILFQEDLATHVKSSNKPKINHHSPSKTAQSFYQKKTSQEQKKSKEAQLNDFLFNYRQQAAEKKQNKIDFLNAIESKLNNLEKQAYEMELDREGQYENLDQILQIHKELGDQIHKNSLVGKIEKTLYETKQEQVEIQEPKGLDDRMEFLEINAAIEDNHEYNNYLIEQVEKVSRSKQKSKKFVESPKKQFDGHKTGIKKANNTQGSLSKTLKKSMGAPPRPVEQKKMTTTWRSKK